jgi:hypothetical protein
MAAFKWNYRTDQTDQSKVDLLFAGRNRGLGFEWSRRFATRWLWPQSTSFGSFALTFDPPDRQLFVVRVSLNV